MRPTFETRNPTLRDFRIVHLDCAPFEVFQIKRPNCQRFPKSDIRLLLWAERDPEDALIHLILKARKLLNQFNRRCCIIRRHRKKGTIAGRHAVDCSI